MESRNNRRNNITGLIYATSFLIYLLCSVYLFIAAVLAPGKIAPLHHFMLFFVIYQLISSLLKLHNNEAVDNEHL